ncbi:sulfite exporter TauE/SafE family protein [Flavobacterium cyanobacteriorum]|uniref:sulfite exporter TauE/SafE family protein n=1 Tax=Flavobacterium cyanobacteriorum TaxID=2022802 RepID=UPI001FB026C0|nr:sulfite exporter TauE/SafE family protein [Flavobacterium cyanobacteriorum]
MENAVLPALAGFVIGAFGTLIGAGGGFILVPLLLIFYPELSPEIVTAISMAVVSVNAVSGTVAYAKSGRIDYKAGTTFALYTIPGSVLGVLVVQYIPLQLFNIIFGILLIVLSVYLFLRNKKDTSCNRITVNRPGYRQRRLTDAKGQVFEYAYNCVYGNMVSVAVGFISPVLGIGGGIIHVPAMVNWLKFPVHIATATSHFILAVMATVSVAVHALQGSYSSEATVKMILLLALGIIPGAQVGAYFSHKIKSHAILRLLSVCLLIVGMRILYNSFTVH